MTTDWTALFEDTFAMPVSPVETRVWREVFGSEYPEGVDPFSYVSRSELERVCAEVVLDANGHLVDVGCGRGGPGLWVAAHTGARLTGIDVAESALAAAEQRAKSLGLAARATFHLGRFDLLPLDDGSVDAVMSIDALPFAPDKALALVELARVLRPGGRLVITTWDYRSQPKGRPPQVDDHRPLLEAAGLGVHLYEETEDWLGRQSRVVAGLLAAADELAAESGDSVEELRDGLEDMRATFANMRRRVFISAVKY
jgi:SAM-dependent methyltransferase